MASFLDQRRHSQIRIDITTDQWCHLQIRIVFFVIILVPKHYQQTMTLSRYVFAIPSAVHCARKVIFMSHLSCRASGETLQWCHCVFSMDPWGCHSSRATFPLFIVAVLCLLRSCSVIINTPCLAWDAAVGSHLANCTSDQMCSAFDQMCTFNQFAYMRCISSR